AVPLPADLEPCMTISATLTLEEAGARPWDVLVVGAGPAGALAAHGLARRGLAVLLVDKAGFPRWKVCGGSLHVAALATLEQAGLGELVGQSGAVSLADVRVAAGRRHAILPLPGGAALSREALDAALVRAALAVGSHFLPETQAKTTIADTDCRGV